MDGSLVSDYRYEFPFPHADSRVSNVIIECPENVTLTVADIRAALAAVLGEAERQHIHFDRRKDG